MVLLPLLLSTACAHNPLQDNNCNHNEDRKYIAHRGVNMGCTIAGENSLEAVRLAKRAGFKAVETDVRMTSDSVLVVMHDETINRTCLNSDGTLVTQPVGVAELSMDELKTNYLLKASDAGNRTPVPTLKEFLSECKKCNILPFIEPKLNDNSGIHYRNIVDLADEVMGRNNFIITSNNMANEVLRKMGFDDLPIMGILYQTSFEKIDGLGNCIVAISPSRFTQKDFEYYVGKAEASGLKTESHANSFSHFQIINSRNIDYISTDIIAPDLMKEPLAIRDIRCQGDFNYYTEGQDNVLFIPAGDSVILNRALPEIFFGGLFLRLTVSGICIADIGKNTFTIGSDKPDSFCYQLMVYDEVPHFRLTASEECVLSNLQLILAEY